MSHILSPWLQGIVAALKDGYGFIQCADRDARMFFHYSEFMDPDYIPEDKAEVQFTVMPVSFLSRMITHNVFFQLYIMKISC